MYRRRMLIVLLRFVGVTTCTAVIASIMPTTWIVATHQWLGLGEFPEGRITEYLARSISALYATFGVLMIVVSTDEQRYAPIIRLLGHASIAFGLLITGIDMMAGMPPFWTLTEGPTSLILGVVILFLARRMGGRSP